ncbi:CIR protein PIR protein [Plasmodium vinckei petteri]|uniref:CIR protein PIR protein n=1 Tax=Plasmodium vinckei petteri TaxID=138298 RepID=A0A6V7STE9_PLAVN|nr:CIR protein PIR protein [Plasmodium vinckei petteri]
MAKPSYNIEDVYRAISTINGYFYEEKQNGATIQKTEKIIHDYCHYGKASGNGNCSDYFQKASSGVIHLLKKLKGVSGLECDKLGEYAILWLSYKLLIKPKNNGVNLNHFYTNYIVKNNDYNNKIKDNDNDSLTYKAIIDTKKDLMNIKKITEFSYPFSILFYLYNVIKGNSLDCKKYPNYANNFAKQFEELSKDSNNIEGSSYNKMLSTLSNDYNNLKKIYDNKNSCNFPPLPEIKPKKKPSENPAEISGRGFEQISGQTSEVISSSSSISTTLIPGLSVVSAIPVFLGIAYKYSLFGIDKLFQRQYLRKKLKKVKKKMKLNI